MSLAGALLRRMGWTVEITAPDFDKCIICVAPHTSNWDFILGMLAYRSAGRKAGFLMKDTWFFFPLGCLFRALGGIPVPRGSKRRGASLVDTIVNRFNSSPRLQIAITPEGTRSRTEQWRTGFLQISLKAGVPCVLAAIDYRTKHITVDRVFHPTGDIQADMRGVKDYYRAFTGKHPENFTAD